MEDSLILIVDDDAASREALTDLLYIESYQVETAVNGESLFAFLEQTLPDVILLDVMMPKLNGFEICRRLKANPQWQHIPVVLITALNSRPSLLQGLKAGADEFLSKPVSGAELRARVRNMVRLKRQYDAMQATIQLQEDLVQLAVHDMRTPLTTILLHASTLLFKSRLESDKWSLDVISSETRRLDNFIDDLLILIKKDNDRLRLSHSQVDICNLIREAVGEAELLANAANVEILLSLPPENKRVALDANLFRRVVDNLVSNAIKHSPMGGKIKISVYFRDSAAASPGAIEVAPGQQGARLMVADEGEGVSPELRDRIFEMGEIFNLKQRGISQTGIGLAFCKLVVGEHSGNIYLTDNQPKGSVIVVDL